MKTLTAMVAATALLAAAGCGKTETYGAELSDAKLTPVKEIVAAPGDFDGETVKVEGTITTECPSGCWFDVTADGVPLRVDIAGAGLAIPQRVGSTVTVEGEIRKTDGGVVLDGKGVRLQ